MSKVMVGSARIDERGRAHGGKAGDNNGKEVSTQAWYLHAKGWRVLRAKDPEDGEKIAAAMEAACKNDNIGYDQYQRLTLWNQVKDQGYDPAKAEKKCECDCSSLVRVCMAFAGIIVDNFRTTNQAKITLATGKFVELTSSQYTKKPDYLKRGDILVTKTQGHTVVALNDGDQTEGYNLGDRTLRKGMEGQDVGQLQTALMDIGYELPRYGADCDFGSETEGAVKQFQDWKNLAVDGVYGPDTHDALMDALEEQDAPGEPEPMPKYPIDALDLSQYNSSKFNQIDWKAIKRDVGFLILRAGITRLTTNPLGIGPDKYFERFAEKCNEYGIPFWAYYYSHSNSVQEAREEAEYLYKVASPYKPVGYCLDCEERGIKVGAFFARLYELGAEKTMLYIGHNWYKVYDLPTDEDGFIKVCDATWIPRYGKNDGTAKDKYIPKYPCDLWQYSSVFSYAGIPDKTIDVNRITKQRRDMAWFRGEE